MMIEAEINLLKQEQEMIKIDLDNIKKMANGLYSLDRKVDYLEGYIRDNLRILTSKLYSEIKRIQDHVFGFEKKDMYTRKHINRSSRDSVSRFSNNHQNNGARHSSISKSSIDEPSIAMQKVFDDIIREIKLGKMEPKQPEGEKVVLSKLDKVSRGEELGIVYLAEYFQIGIPKGTVDVSKDMILDIVNNIELIKYRQVSCKELFNALRRDDPTYVNERYKDLESIEFPDIFKKLMIVDTSRMFRGCTNLKKVDLTHFNTSKVLDMSEMFSRCTSLRILDLSYMTTFNTINMSYMFSLCTNLNTLDLSSFNTINTSDVSGIFLGDMGSELPRLQTVVCPNDPTCIKNILRQLPERVILLQK